MYRKRRSFRNKGGDVLMSWPEATIRRNDERETLF